jgi:hypothetical protein
MARIDIRAIWEPFHIQRDEGQKGWDERRQKNKKRLLKNQKALFVPGAGIEPALSKELVFETSASTNSAIRANTRKRVVEL